MRMRTDPIHGERLRSLYGPVVVSDANMTFVVTLPCYATSSDRKLERRFEVSHDRLILMPTNAQESWCVTYQRS